jgi:hypothetical protein
MAAMMSLKVHWKEEAVMFRRIVIENPKFRIAVIAVKTCSEAISTQGLGHGKNPYFLQVTFLQLVGPDYPLLILPCVDGTKSMECAF